MQWHKRDSCTHSIWHQVFYTYCTSLLLPQTKILYRTRNETGLEFDNITQCCAGVCTFSVVHFSEIVCNIFKSSSLFFLFFCFAPPSLLSVLLLCVFHQPLHTNSFSFLHAVFDLAAPSQGLVTFFLQVTEMRKGEIMSECSFKCRRMSQLSLWLIIISENCGLGL